MVKGVKKTNPAPSAALHPEQLEAAPYLPRFTLIFDREGYSPMRVLFQRFQIFQDVHDFLVGEEEVHGRHG